MTEHPRAGAKPAHTHVKDHASYQDAERIAKRLGFEKVGLVVPAPKMTQEARVPDRTPTPPAAVPQPAPAAAEASKPDDNGTAPIMLTEGVGRTKAGSITGGSRGVLSPETIARAKAVRAYVDKGMQTTKAIEQVAKDLRVPNSATIHAAYYTWRKREIEGAPELATPSNLIDISNPRALGAHLRELRERRGWTHAEVAKRLGNKYPGALSNIENGKVANPKKEYITRIAKLYDTTLDQLVAIGNTPTRQTPSKAEAAIATAQQPREVTTPEAVALPVSASVEPMPAPVEQERQARARQQLGVSVVEDEHSDPNSAADAFARQRVKLFQQEWQAIKDAHAALDAEVTAILARMELLEHREEQLRKGAAHFGVDLPAIRQEAQ